MEILGVVASSGGVGAGGGGLPAAPVLTAPALILGTPIVGETAQANVASWDDEGGEGVFSFIWYRDGVGIEGESAGTYIWTEDDVGTMTTVLVTLENAGGSDEDLSDPVGPVEAIADGTPLTPMTMFEPQIHRAWFQEDVAEGAVASWVSQGRSPATAVQATAENQPTRLADNGGVSFDQGSVQWLEWPVDVEATYSHRWWLVIAKADLSAATNPLLLSIHGTGTSQAARQPLIDFDVTGNTMRSAVHDGTSRVQTGAADDGEWNILLGYRRGATVNAVVNGVGNVAVDFAGFRPNNVSAPSRMGHSTTTASPADMAIDCVIFGDGELTDDQIDVLVGWAHWRVGRQGVLASDHRFKDAAPVASDMGPSDFHTVEEYDSAAWAAWDTAVDAVRYTHRGEQTFDQTGYTRVFFTDFDLADQAPVQSLTGTQGHPWYAPGWLTTLALEADDRQSNGQFWPDVYVQDTGSTAGGVGRPGTLTIRMYNDGVWKSGQIYSVNDNGYGRSWGKGIFRVRMKFSPLTAPLPGLFPGPQWFYGTEHIFLRSRNRVEQDTIELTGKGAAWNEGSVHVHVGRFPDAGDPTITTIEVHNKVYGYESNVSTGFPEEMDAFDGEWHDWVCRIEDDLTYYYVSINGVLYETCRVPTIYELTMPKYWVTNHALDGDHGDRTPDTDEVFDMVIDYIEILQRESELITVSPGFSALPTVAGTMTSGSTLTVTPHTTASQVEYRWYRDGVPITTALTSSYGLTADDVGHKIRVNVKAKSLVDQPECWSLETATIS